MCVGSSEGSVVYQSSKLTLFLPKTTYLYNFFHTLALVRIIKILIVTLLRTQTEVRMCCKSQLNKEVFLTSSDYLAVRLNTEVRLFSMIRTWKRISWSCEDKVSPTASEGL